MLDRLVRVVPQQNGAWPRTSAQGISSGPCSPSSSISALPVAPS